MEFEFFTPKKTAKATVHKRTGRLGFSKWAAEKICFEHNKHFKIAKNKKDKNDNDLYLIASKDDNMAFKAIKSGVYYSINIKSLLAEMGINYVTKSVVYEVQEMKMDKIKCYRLKRIQ